jgi:hypothetical protein
MSKHLNVSIGQEMGHGLVFGILLAIAFVYP